MPRMGKRKLVYPCFISDVEITKQKRGRDKVNVFLSPLTYFSLNVERPQMDIHEKHEH